jgi:signal peptidase I
MPAHAPSPSHARRRPLAVRIAVAVLCVWLLTLGLLYLAGYRPLVVHSASMAPAVDTGDLVITRAVAPGTVAVGDIVSFHDRSREGRLVTHRVTERRRDGQRVAFVTRGDVNTAQEHWSSDSDARVGTLALRIPLAGYAVTWLTRPAIVLGLLAIVLALFAGAVVGARAARHTRRGVVRAALTGLASAAAIVSAPLMLGATQGAFSATTDNPGNTFAAAATFCGTAPRVLTSTADTYVAQENPTTNDGADPALQVASSSGQNSRVLVRFALPVAPVDPRCPMTSAVLQLNVLFLATTGRTLHAKRATAAWGEMTATWNNMPATTDVGLAATPSSGGQVNFDVTAQVASMYAGTNNGFLIRDSVENFFGTQIYYAREGGNAPSLTITYG